MRMRAYREQCRYELWTLSELMLDPYCCTEMLSHGGLQPVLKFLSSDNAAGTITLNPYTLPNLGEYCRMDYMCAHAGATNLGCSAHMHATCQEEWAAHWNHL